MRANNRVNILDAAVRVADRVGASRVTLEATAAEAGVTRGGMTYHFHDRDALALAMQEHLASQWESRLEDAAGKSAAEATPAERLAAYVMVAAVAATRTELELIVETGHDPVLHEPWAQVQHRWTPPETAPGVSGATPGFIARLAADGLWAFGALGGGTLSAQTRLDTARRIIALSEDISSSSSR